MKKWVNENYRELMMLAMLLELLMIFYLCVRAH